MATEVHNPSVEITSLPAPLSGVLKGGQRIVLSYTPAALAAASPSLGSAFRLRDLGDAYAGSNDDASFGLAANQSVAQTITINDATTDNFSTGMTLSHTTTGTAAAGIGASLLFKAENAAGSSKLAALYAGYLSTVTDTSEIGVAQIYPTAAGAPVAGVKIQGVASAVNGIEVLPSATTAAVRMYPYGTDTNISVRVQGKGTGSWALTNPANSTVYVEGNSTGLGFFGVTPIARPLLATGASATVDNVIAVLQNLGLVRQS